MVQVTMVTIVVIALLGVAQASTSSAMTSTVRRSGLDFRLGKCSADDYYVRIHLCSKSFYETVRRNGVVAPNCSTKYSTLRGCMLGVYDDCLNGTLFNVLLGRSGVREQARNNYLAFLGDERYWCTEGGLGVPRYIHAGTNCNPVYAHITKDCVRNYQRFFNSRSTYTRLCWEYHRGKTCLLQNAINHCSFTTIPLSQMMQMIVDVTFDYQPYCRTRVDVATYDQMLHRQTCPPRAHADVIFAVDVSSGTSDAEFQSMKEAIRDIAKKLDFGMSGIRIGFAQFHERTKVSIRLNRYPNLRSFQRGLNRTRRIYTLRHQRHTGSALRYLADNIFDLESNRSVIRPFHTPLCVVMTTGASDDVTEAEAVRTLVERNVHVVRMGPHYSNNNADSDVTMTVDDTLNFTSSCGDVVEEVCFAERLYRDSIRSTPSQATTSAPMDFLNRILSLGSQAHLPLLWQPQPLIFHPFSISSVQEDARGVGTGFNISEFAPLQERVPESFPH
uniref:Uncharacterized LOC100185619 n=1 Tax=Ciona intestinalis TaxID=7719 RepID=F6W0L7_CIOIN|nr:uncharacterized protein LOC100185619 [Ciona intestinalis]|eukprot:XP_002129164.1 uncharacterized protein LOC100185619 [Ciona intestinalis]